MRLGPLARKLERTPTEIIEFLSSKSIVIDEGVNSKLEQAHIALILQQYAPELRADFFQNEDETTAGLPATTPVEEPGTGGNASPEPAPDVEEPSQPEAGEVIRAPKVELAGLKVLGKIDLPEPKKKTETPQENETSAEPPKEFKRERRNQNFKKSGRPAKNPVAMQREQEALEAQRKREEELKLQKERRTQNYLKKVKPHQPTKAAKLIREEAVQLSSAELKERPKTWWGKLVHWFTS